LDSDRKVIRTVVWIVIETCLGHDRTVIGTVIGQ